MFNVSSSKESQFQALYSFSAVRRFFCQFAYRIRQVTNITNGTTRPHVDVRGRISDSWEEESSDYQSTLSACAGPTKETIFSWISMIPKFCSTSREGTYFSPESALTMERWRNTLESEIYSGVFDQRG